ncbi:hypothetical protein AB674_19440 [Flavobacterium sp. ABG]|nr:hypothetical protein AB674_19440 [Flavobacterium sp. ABG]
MNEIVFFIHVFIRNLDDYKSFAVFFNSLTLFFLVGKSFFSIKIKQKIISQLFKKISAECWNIY